MIWSYSMSKGMAFEVGAHTDAILAEFGLMEKARS